MQLRRAGWRAASSLRCHTCAARCGSIWEQVGPEQLDVLDQRKRVRVVNPGDVVYQQGERCTGLYVVQRGTVALRKFDEAGNSVLLRLVHPGQALGYRCFFDTGTYRAQAQALDTVRLCFLTPALLRTMLHSDPGVVMGMMKRLARELGEADDRFLMATRRSVRTRMAHALLQLRDRHGAVDDGGVLTLTLPVSRQDLADLLGTRPETVARTTKALERDGVAYFQGRVVTIPDLDTLMDEVDSDGPA